ncbi:unnamed protein product, partial [Owenia fusiformis]
KVGNGDADKERMNAEIEALSNGIPNRVFSSTIDTFSKVLSTAIAEIFKDVDRSCSEEVPTRPPASIKTTLSTTVAMPTTTTTQPPCCSCNQWLCGFDIALVVDLSCSINQDNKTIIGENLPKIADQIQALGGCGIDTLHTSLTVITYAKDTITHWELGSPSDCVDLKEKLERIDVHRDVDCNTRTSDALEAARQQFIQNGRSDNNQAVLMITDGASYPKQFHKSLLAITTLYKEEGRPIYVITLPNDMGDSASTGKDTMELEIKAMSNSYQDRVFSTGFRNFGSTLEEAINAMYVKIDRRCKLGKCCPCDPVPMTVPTLTKRCTCDYANGYQHISDNCWMTEKHQAGCFKVYKEKATWKQAEEICRQDGGHLARWNNEECFQDISSYLTEIDDEIKSYKPGEKDSKTDKSSENNSQKDKSSENDSKKEKSSKNDSKEEESSGNY